QGQPLPLESWAVQAPRHPGKLTQRLQQLQPGGRQGGGQVVGEGGGCGPPPGGAGGGGQGRVGQGQPLQEGPFGAGGGGQVEAGHVQLDPLKACPLVEEVEGLQH